MEATISALVSPGSSRADVAAAVRAHLAVRNFSDAEAARRIGVSQPYFSRRTNEAVAFDVDDLGRIANAFDIEIVDLIQMPTRLPRDPKRRTKD